MASSITFSKKYPYPLIVNNCVMKIKCLGPVVQSIVSLISSLVVKMLTVLVSTISNLQVFLLKKM